MSGSELLKTALHAKHVEMAAKMGQEAGWEMPLSFRGPLEEVRQVRTRAGVFDLSHVGRIRVRGDGAVDFLERLCTADVAHQEDDTALYTLMCNDSGGIIDHCSVLRLENYWLLTPSAGSRLKVLQHMQTLAGDFDVKVDDQTEKTVMLCVTGPAAEGILDAVLPVKVAGMALNAVKAGSLMVARYMAVRTDYTGQWSLEVMLPNMMASQAWRFITDKAGANAVPPAGLSARDVLRIEAARPRYGHELNETIDPITAGLERAVDFDHDFIGRQAVQTKKDKLPARTLVGLTLQPPAGGAGAAGIATLGSVVMRTDGSEIGAVTSGTYSPTLETPVALAYVAPEAATCDTELIVDIAGERFAARVVGLPFYRPGSESGECP